MARSVPSITPIIAILLIVFFEGIGGGLIIPIMPSLINKLTGMQGVDHALAYGLVISTSLVITFLFSQALGRASDRFGRRPLMLLTLLGTLLAYLIMSQAVSILYLFLAQIIIGFCAASSSVGRAYISESTSPDNRAQSFGMVTGAMALGFVMGPAIGGYLGQFGERMPFYVAACMTTLTLIFAFFALPESMDPDDRRQFSWRAAQPFAAVPTLIKAPPLVRGVVVASLIEAFAISLPSEIGVLILFMQQILQWNMMQVGFWITMMGVGGALGQAFGTRIAIKLFGERKAWLIGSVGTVVVFVCAGFMYLGWHMYALIFAYSLVSFVGPVALALVSKEVPRNQLGEIHGAFISLASLLKALGISVGTLAFGYFTGSTSPLYLTGVAFFLGALMQVPAVIIAVRTLKRNPDRLPLENA